MPRPPPRRRRGPAGSRTRRTAPAGAPRPAPWSAAGGPRAADVPRCSGGGEGAGESQPTPSRRALAWSASAGQRRSRRERGGAAAGERPDALLRCAGQPHGQLLLVPGASERPLVTTWLGSVREQRALGRRGGARNHRCSGSAGGPWAWQCRAAPQLGFLRGSEAGWCGSRQPGRGRRGACSPRPLAAACPT